VGWEAEFPKSSSFFTYAPRPHPKLGHGCGDRRQLSRTSGEPPFCLNCPSRDPPLSPLPAWRATQPDQTTGHRQAGPSSDLKVRQQEDALRRGAARSSSPCQAAYSAGPPVFSQPRVCPLIAPGATSARPQHRRCRRSPGAPPALFKRSLIP